MRIRRETPRSAVAAVLPKLVLLASVLLGVGLSHATAHFCGMPMAGPLSHVTMHGMAPAPAERHAPHGSVAAPPIASAQQVAATATEPHAEAAHRKGAGEANPFVLCLTAIAAVLAAAVLGLILLCRSSGGVTAGSERPSRLPAVRGSPPSFALSLRRVTVLLV
ncbi:hypothetical protein ACFY05_07410 [Microtetraspora fusca]|uniref:DUF2637 domain-containing protein n=1 Tax=Microtetraspora fusca TaxID=1997 RepID=A0ABW6V156_MICFU